MSGVTFSGAGVGFRSGVAFSGVRVGLRHGYGPDSRVGAGVVGRWVTSSRPGLLTDYSVSLEKVR